MLKPVSSDVDPLAGFHFGVEVEGIVRGYFTECSGVTAEVKVDTYEEGGANQTTRKFPGRGSFGNITLKRGLTADDQFVNWLLDVSCGKKTRKSITIKAFTADLQPLQQWTLLNAFPAKYSIPGLQGTANNAIIESIEFAHEGITV